MSAKSIERRYARALFRAAKNNTEMGRKRLAELAPVAELFAIEAARKVLVSPVMPVDLKVALLDHALAKIPKADGELKKFISMVVEAGRLQFFPGIIAAFKEILDDAEGILKAEVTTAVTIDAGDLKKVSQALQERFGKKSKIELDQAVDPGILGGLVVRVGNSIIDLSVKTKLDMIAKSALT